MQFVETSLAGVFVLHPTPRGDERGFFARIWCAREAADPGLTASFVQWNNSFSAVAGTIRGLHYQAAPHAEAKLVRCIRGSVFDVAVDVRPGSTTYGRWFGTVLSAENRRLLYIGEGLAHGYQTLEADSEVIYGASAFYEPAAERGVRWNDPGVGIAWPFAGAPTLSPKDGCWPDLQIGSPA